MADLDSTRLLQGIVCSAEDYQRAVSFPGEYHCLTRGESIGLAFMVQCGLVSLVAVVWVLVAISRNSFRHWRNPNGSWKVVREPSDLYLLSLFVSDFIQALGAVLSVEWVVYGKTYAGNLCTAQGVIQQLGEATVAITTGVIALHTFSVVWFRKGLHSLRTAKIIMGVQWVFVILFTAIGTGIHTDSTSLYITPTPYWCWISNKYKLERIFGEYIWLWITLALSLFLYLPLFFWSRGNITVDEDHWWKFRLHKMAVLSDDAGNRRKDSLSMIAYPLFYSCLVGPLSVVRWIGFYQEGQNEGVSSIPPTATFTVISVYSLSGACNVLLFLYTRPKLLLFAPPPPSRGRAPSIVSSRRASSFLGMGNGPSSDMDSSEYRMARVDPSHWSRDMPKSPRLGSDT